MAEALEAPTPEIRQGPTIEQVKQATGKFKDAGPLLLVELLQQGLGEAGPVYPTDWLAAAWALTRQIPDSPLGPLIGLAIASPKKVDWQVMARELEGVREVLAGGAEEEAPRLTPMTAMDLLTQDLTPREDVLGNILPEGGLGLLAGSPKSGKTLLALALALAVVRGDPFLEFPTKQGAVLILSGEGGPLLLRERLLKMAGEDRRGLERLHLWWPEKRNLRLDKDEDRTAIVEACKEQEIRLLIIDPLIRHHAIDENSTKEMALLVACLAEIRQKTGSACLLVHHVRKGSRDSKAGSVQEARGSSVLHGEIDAGLVLDRRRSSGDFTLHAELRWAAEPAPMLLELDEETLRFSVTGTLEGGARKLSSKALLELLQDRGPSTVKDLATATETSDKTVRRYLAELEKDGRAACTVGKQGAKSWRAVGDEEEGLWPK